MSPALTPTASPAPPSDPHPAPRPTPGSAAGQVRALRARQRRHVRGLMVADLFAVGAAVAVGYLARFTGEVAVIGEARPALPYGPVSVGLVAAWLIALRLARCYDSRVIGYGTEQYRRLLRACFGLAASVAIGLYLLDIGVSRGFLAISFTTGTFALTGVRLLANVRLHRARSRGAGWTRRVLLVGDAPHVLEMLGQLRRAHGSGYEVVGACIPDALVAPQRQHLAGVPVVGSFKSILAAAVATSADTVAVTASGELTASRLRRLGWQMEGTDLDLVVAPALTEVAGPRIHTRPVAGLPLLHVEAPEFRGYRKLVKELFDRTVALTALIVVAPVCLVIALAVKLTSRGRVLFRQMRVGRGGHLFPLLKFRTMVAGAHGMRDVLADRNETDGLLFKIRDDPRVTRVGRWLRRWSLDELPQLCNVVLGHMSLVGPRPPLPEEVAAYDGDVARRLLVKPGITGLWQVSGRSDLSWEDGVRLDLYYVENWSLATDLVILWRTMGAVFRARGAY